MKCIYCGREHHESKLSHGVCHDCAEDWFSVRDAADFVWAYDKGKSFTEWIYGVNLENVQKPERLVGDTWKFYFWGKNEYAKSRVHEYVFGECYSEWTEYLRKTYPGKDD